MDDYELVNISEIVEQVKNESKIKERFSELLLTHIEEIEICLEHV